MKIAILYASWEDYGEPWSTPRGIKTELERRGHEVHHYNLYHWNGKLNPRNNLRQYSNEGFNAMHNDYRNGQKFDAILVMDYGPYQNALLNHSIFPDVVLIKECGDEPQAFAMHNQTAGQFDILLSPDFECVERYKAAGLNAVYWTHFADTSIFHQEYDVEPEFDCITTCGGRRFTEEIESALGDQFNNERYFFGEDHAKRLLMGNMVFQSSQFQEVTRRIFEGMACGRMVICDKPRPEANIDSLFVEDEDLVYFNTAEEAIEKIRYYTEHEEERERIAENGYKKVMEFHTQYARVDELERLIGVVKNDQFAQKS